MYFKFDVNDRDIAGFLYIRCHRFCENKRLARVSDKKILILGNGEEVYIKDVLVDKLQKKTC